MGFDHFKLAFELIIGSSLTMRLTVANDSSQPLHFEEAMHTYYEVVDVHEASVTGLEPTSFIDKTDNFRVKPPAHAPIAFTTFTDRVYENTAATCVITDVPGKREITVAKTNSNTTVVFNPWKELPDMGPDEWHEMLALETVNAASNAVTLEPGKTHTMQAHVTVEHTGK
jgi:glucose-6-phosphate 1-epimerase